MNYRVEKTEWNDVTGKWTITTSAGKKYLANFVFSASGALHIPNDTRFTGYLFSEDTYFHTQIILNLPGRGRCEFTPKSFFLSKVRIEFICIFVIQSRDKINIVISLN